MKSIKNKILVILGPTASGKTSLGVKLAAKYNGEIISADSRQVYRYMDIGTGKDLCEYEIIKNKKKIKINHHLIDVVSPNTEFHLAKYLKLSQIAIKNILDKDRLPIIVGGTGLYLQALVDGYNLSSTGSDPKLRERLEKENREDLWNKLKNLNNKFAQKLNNSERHNKQRLMRYIELCQGDFKIKSKNLILDNHEFLILGIKIKREKVLEKIYKRLRERLEKEDMIGEVERLNKKHRVSWKRLKSFGLEYKYISLYLQKKIDYDEMFERLNIAIRQFAKRQMSWFRRWERQGRKIHWISNIQEAEKIVKKFL